MQRLAAVLLGISIVLLIWNHFGMNQVVELSGLSEQRSGKRDDSAEKGASVSMLARSGGDLVLDCLLREGYAWPYCGYYFSPGDAPDGIDLSGFDTVTVDLQHDGPPPHTMRLYVRNFEPGLSTVGRFETQKVNEVEFELTHGGPVTIPLHLMRTAEWWNTAQKVPLARRNTRMDHVTDVELYTGEGTVLGRHRFVLKSLRFQGKRISQYGLLLLLAGVWLAFGIVWLVLGLVHHRANLQASRARLAKLSSIDRALELEAQEPAGQVHVDGLTGTLNRQGLRNLLLKHLVDGDGEPFPCAVMFIDIDGFKRINDGHGPAVGDAVLHRMATAVRRDIRATDNLVHWAGDVFLVVCPGAAIGSARMLAEELRASMAREMWPAALEVTASFGITQTDSAEHIGAALARAGQALRRAKENGRDRIEVEAPAGGAP